eukprot:NODE_2359_length_1082_cov_64.937173_g2341_i0.p1 GENE.NODE_2359_length_1082_cov_64.937173_g2341_i0~~NODE_2359_length_1082_cov_64.937173_g2341_i0.p1  ORF type:complete len:330 (+),score=63.05 NODE_2359_length_1082_cov_64.937173_g2341_i0:82-990(+)
MAELPTVESFEGVHAGLEQLVGPPPDSPGALAASDVSVNLPPGTATSTSMTMLSPTLRSTARHAVIKTPAQRRWEADVQEAQRHRKANADTCNSLMDIVTNSFKRSDEWAGQLRELKELERQLPTVVNPPTSTTVHTTLPHPVRPLRAKHLLPLRSSTPQYDDTAASLNVSAIPDGLNTSLSSGQSRAARRLDSVKRYALAEPLQGMESMAEPGHYNIEFKTRARLRQSMAANSRADGQDDGEGDGDGVANDPRKQLMRKASRFEMTRITQLTTNLLGAFGSAMESHHSFDETNTSLLSKLD